MVDRMIIRCVAQSRDAHCLFVANQAQGRLRQVAAEGKNKRRVFGKVSRLAEPPGYSTEACTTPDEALRNSIYAGRPAKAPEG